mgnify:CR=1 FL=1
MSAVIGEGEKHRRLRLPIWLPLPSRSLVGKGVIGISMLGVGGLFYKTDNQVNGQVIDCNKTPGQSAKKPVSLSEGTHLGGVRDFYGNYSEGVSLSTDTDGSMLVRSSISDGFKIPPDRVAVIAEGITVRPDDSLRFTDNNNRYDVTPTRDSDGYYSGAEVVIFCLNKPSTPSPTPSTGNS